MPRHTDMPPKWSASKLGCVCLKSTSYVTGAAAAAVASRPPATRVRRRIELRMAGILRVAVNGRKAPGRYHKDKPFSHPERKPVRRRLRWFAPARGKKPVQQAR